MDLQWFVIFLSCALLLRNLQIIWITSSIVTEHSNIHVLCLIECG